MYIDLTIYRGMLYTSTPIIQKFGENEGEKEKKKKTWVFSDPSESRQLLQRSARVDCCVNISRYRQIALVKDREGCLGIELKPLVPPPMEEILPRPVIQNDSIDFTSGQMKFSSASPRPSPMSAQPSASFAFQSRHHVTDCPSWG